MADADFFLCVVGSLDDAYRHAFEKLGAMVRTVRRFSPKHPHSNKIRFFELSELGQYDFALCLDCDTVLVQDPSAYILGTPCVRRSPTCLLCPTRSLCGFSSISGSRCHREFTVALILRMKQLSTAMPV